MGGEGGLGLVHFVHVEEEEEEREGGKGEGGVREKEERVKNCGRWGKYKTKTRGKGASPQARSTPWVKTPVFPSCRSTCA